jgi:hypothetical protein
MRRDMQGKRLEVRPKQRSSVHTHSDTAEKVCSFAAPKGCSGEKSAGNRAENGLMRA